MRAGPYMLCNASRTDVTSSRPGRASRASGEGSATPCPASASTSEVGISPDMKAVAVASAASCERAWTGDDEQRCARRKDAADEVRR